MKPNQLSIADGLRRPQSDSMIGWRLFGLLLAFVATSSQTLAQGLDGFAPLVQGGPVKALAIQDDGAIVVGGSFDSVDGQTRGSLARILADGRLDQSFDYEPASLLVDVRSLAITSTNEIIVGGIAGNLVRLNPDSTVDGAFNSSNVNSVVATALEQVGGKLVFSTQDGIGRLRWNGSSDPTFNPQLTDPGNPQINGYAGTLRIDSNGGILVGGGFTFIGSHARHYIARLKSNGDVDGSFDPNANAAVNAMVLLPGGDILVGGAFTVIDGQSRNGFARLDRNGHVLPTFNPNVTGTVLSIVLDGDGVVLGGSFGLVSGTARQNVARLHGDGTLDLSYDPQVVGLVDAMARQDDGKLVIGGYITFVGNHPRNRVARLNPDGSADDSFGAGTNGPVYALAAWSDNSLMIGGLFDTLETSQGVQITLPGIAWTKADGDNPVSSFHPAEVCTHTTCWVNAIALQPDDRKIVLGNSYYDPLRPEAEAKLRADGAASAITDAAQPQGGIGNAITPIMRLYPSGLLDPPFDLNLASISGDVYAVLRQPDGRLLVAGCMQFPGSASNALVLRLDTGGGFDNTFEILYDNDAQCRFPNHHAAYALALLSDGKIVVGGNFSYFVDPFAGAPNLAILRSNGHPDFPIYADGGPVYALAVQSDDGILVGGDFTSIDDEPRSRIGRVYPSIFTPIDPGFDPGANAAIRSIVPRADGKLFVGGDFTSIGGTSRNHLALLSAQGEVQQSFQADVNAPVHALALQSDGKIVLGGEFTSVGGIAHNHVARLGVPDPAHYAIDYVPRPPLAPWVFWSQQGAGPIPGSPPDLSWSVDGITYSNAGAMTFDANAQRWTYGSFTPPRDQLLFLRVRMQTSSGGRIETVKAIFDADGIFDDGFD